MQFVQSHPAFNDTIDSLVYHKYMEGLMTLFGEVRKASSLLAVSSLEERREALVSISKLLEEEKDRIKAENDKDLENAEKSFLKG